MEIIKLNSENHSFVIQKAVDTLKNHGLLVYPTETCYGVGVDGTSQIAVDKVLQYKSKREDKPLSVAVCNKDMAQEYAVLNETAHNIFDNFLPGPITVVCKDKNKLAKGVASSLSTLGLRLPAYPLVLEIVKAFGKPITATSANVSYKKTPYSIQDILDNTSQKQKNLLGLLIDAGDLPKRKTSTVVDTTLEGIHILREGDIIIQNCRVFVSQGEESTRKFAQQILQEVEEYLGKKLILFELYGDLGAGKTYFTKFFNHFLGVTNTIVSPTFTLCNEYKACYKGKNLEIYHIDAYRMYDPREMDDLGSETLFANNHLVFIEWASKVEEYLNAYKRNAIVVKIHLMHVAPEVRKIEYSISSM
ncbi:MAG: threonylcarbamoyl-AMP synthase [Candidatus Brocadiae bacterium]|nr:threonylcarbamoyl-AMP synthase [Candidatus Brocadiia bacterium]